MRALTGRFLREVVKLPATTVAVYGEAVAWAVVVALLAAAVAVAQVYAGMVSHALAAGRYQDFALFYESAVRAGAADAAAVAPARGPAAPADLNPPIVALLLVPLTALRVDQAYLVWMGLGVVCLASAGWLIARSLRLSAGQAALLGLCVFVSAPFAATVISGQLAAALVLPFTLAWRAARAGTCGRAGLWLGACASVKPFLLLFLPYFVVVGQRTAAGAAVAAVAALWGVSLAVAGPSAFAAWVSHLRLVTWEEHALNASWLGVVSRSLVSSEWRYTPLATAEWLRAPLWFTLAAATIAVTLVRVRRSTDVDRQWLAVGAAALLASPLGWVYYCLMLVGPLWAVLAAEVTRRSRAGWLALAASLALLIPPGLPSRLVVTPYGVVTATLGSLYGWALVAVWVAAIRAPDRGD